MVFFCSGDFSDLCDEGRFNAAIEGLDSGDQNTVRTFTSAISHLLQIYIANNDRKQGRRIHRLARKCGLDSNPYLGTRLILLYNFFECLPEAKSAFRRITDPNVHSWNAIMSAYARAGQFHQVMSIYHTMRSSMVYLNSFVLVSVLKACCNEEDIMNVHSHVITYGLESEVFVGSTLIDLYVKHGRLDEALTVFHRLTSQNVVTWSTLIAGYAQHERAEAALHLFAQMQLGDLQANTFTFVAVLKACATVGDMEGCRLIHSQIVENALETDTIVVSATVDMYAKTGNLDDAHAIFDSMAVKCVVTWCALISGHAQHGQCREALKLFWEMLRKGIMPDNIAFSTILQLCPKVAAFEQGIMIHMHAVECGLPGDLFVGSALVGMYARCGNLEDACIIFEHLHRRSVLTWSTIIYMCAQHNDFIRAVKYFEDMQAGCMKPNSMVFHALLLACSCAGLVYEGIYYMKLMREAHNNILVMPEHFNSMVDLLGRKGCLDVAEDLLETLHFQSDGKGWLSLLWACRLHGAVELGRRCFDCLLSLGTTDSAYVLLSSIYSQACMVSDVEAIEEMRESASLPREVLTAYIEIDKQVHAFTEGDVTHPQMEEIVSKLRDLGEGTQEAHDRIKGASEEALCGHTEKLAVALGLVSLPQGTVIRVSKNPWMCTGCHSFLKDVSKAEARDIVVSVVDRIHRFHEGVCCCQDLL